MKTLADATIRVIADDLVSKHETPGGAIFELYSTGIVSADSPATPGDLWPAVRDELRKRAGWTR